MVKTKTLEKHLKRNPKKDKVPEKGDYLSTGSTELNLACSGFPTGGLLKGKYYLLVGDSSSGKTVFVLTILAEAANNTGFENYDLVFDDVEGGALFDMAKFYGKKMASRIEPPRRDKEGDPIYSETVEDVYYNIDDRYEKFKQTGRPFIYIVDSMDALVTMDDEAHFQKKKKSKQDGGQAKGSYMASKPKLNSMYLRRLMFILRKTGSIVIFISQTRDGFNMFEPKTRSGGKALTFYATLELWTSRKTTFKMAYRDQKLPIGILARVRVKKNRVKGKDRTVYVPIYEQFKNGGGGIDDIGAMVDFLVKWKAWPKSRGKIEAKEFEFTGTRERIVQMVENDRLYRRLQRIVSKVWDEIENAVAVNRVSRYE